MEVCAIILAGGIGSRMKSPVPKQKIEICGETVLARTLKKFEQCESVSSCIVVTLDDELDFAKSECAKFSKVKKIVAGGKSRAESARNGFFAIDFSCDFVALHDGARCLVTVSDIDAVIADAEKFGSATASNTVTDTFKLVDENNDIVDTLTRRAIRSVQTPQVFAYRLYKKALESADLTDESITDDNSLMERIGVRVHCTETSQYNIKITYSSDLDLAEFLLLGGKIDDGH